MKADHFFMDLIEGLYDTGLMLLGRKKHPNTNGTIKNLDEANRTINILMALEVKTRGNLNFKESNRLRQIITELQAIYIEEMNQK